MSVPKEKDLSSLEDLYASIMGDGDLDFASGEEDDEETTHSRLNNKPYGLSHRSEMPAGDNKDGPSGANPSLTMRRSTAWKTGIADAVQTKPSDISSDDFVVVAPRNRLLSDEYIMVDQHSAGSSESSQNATSIVESVFVTANESLSDHSAEHSSTAISNRQSYRTTVDVLDSKGLSDELSSALSDSISSLRMSSGAPAKSTSTKQLTGGAETVSFEHVKDGPDVPTPEGGITNASKGTEEVLESAPESTSRLTREVASDVAPELLSDKTSKAVLEPLEDVLERVEPKEQSPGFKEAGSEAIPESLENISKRAEPKEHSPEPQDAVSENPIEKSTVEPGIDESSNHDTFAADEEVPENFPQSNIEPTSAPEPDFKPAASSFPAGSAPESVPEPEVRQKDAPLTDCLSVSDSGSAKVKLEAAEVPEASPTLIPDSATPEVELTGDQGDSCELAKTLEPSKSANSEGPEEPVANEYDNSTADEALVEVLPPAPTAELTNEAKIGSLDESENPVNENRPVELAQASKDKKPAADEDENERGSEHKETAASVPASAAANSAPQADKASSPEPETVVETAVEAETKQFDDQTVFLYASMAGGGRGFMSKYNKAVLILQANEIDFVPVEITLDDAAVKLWRRWGASKGKSLPAVIRDGEVKLDYDELLEAEEKEEVFDAVFDY